MKKLALVFLLLLASAAWGDPTFTIDAGTSTGDFNAKILGQATSAFHKGADMWDDTSWQVPSLMLPMLRGAGAGAGATVRFPSREDDDYYWRRGVGERIG